MRYTQEHKSETHGRIVKKAAEEFRRNGLEGIGIASLMSSLGLTHGGFYAHFQSKDDLIGDASVCILEENLARMMAIAEAAPAGKSVQAVLDYYLSPQHRDNPAMGCVLPSLASELARKPQEVRDAFTKGLDEAFDRLAALMPGKSRDKRKELAIAFFTAMAGAILVARAVSDPELSDRILGSARQSLSATFAH
ncbi:MAG: TetR/AcrR family transcriptional regulator [Rhodospirillales bacterium]|nr:MAG: TetR/AcrR family transcriptional regulator [Rhodospirillales bacterium]